MIEVFVSAVGSLLASAVLLTLMLVLSKRLRRYVYRVVLSASRLGILDVYPNQAAAAQDIRKQFSHSPRIRVLTFRAKHLLTSIGDFAGVIDSLTTAQQMDFLIGDPSARRRPDYVQLRGEELRKIDGEPPDQYIEEIRSDLAMLRRRAQEDALICVRAHNTPAVFRLFLFDHDLFVEFYFNNSRAATGTVLHIAGGSILYRAFARYFQLVWIGAREVR